MVSSILVTGVTGTGKTTICAALKDLGHNAVDIESIDGLYELINEKTGVVVPGKREQIKEGLDWNCNKTRLLQLIKQTPSGLTFYCGGMSNTEEVWDVFDKVVILTVNDETTRQRLSERDRGQFGSTPEQREWVLSWKHDLEHRWFDRGGIAVNAEASPSEVAKQVVAASSR